MSGKGRRHREARRRARRQPKEERPDHSLEEEGIAAEATAPRQQERPPHGEEARPHAAMVGAGQGGAAHKRRKRGAGRRRLRLSPWLIATPVVAIGAAILAVLILTSGSSGTTGPAAESTADPRVAELAPTASFTIEAGDDGTGNGSFFRPNTISAKAGDVIELVVTNTGAVSHNLRVSGPDGEYDTGDDFEPQPLAIKPGETVRTAVKIEAPGTYPFRCDFHPALQIGTLVLS